MSSPSAKKYSLGVILAIAAVRLYQRLAPIRLRACCCFQPTCSEFAVVVFRKFGLLRGIHLVGQRLARCRPENAGIRYS